MALSIFATLSLIPGASLRAQETPADAAGQEVQQAAIRFLDSLTPELRDQVTMDFNGPQRQDWQFVPLDRTGVHFGEMDLEQRKAAHALLRSALSDQGYLKATTIMTLELILREMESTRPNVEEIRDPEKYWFAVYGDPASEGPWGWRIEGHHLSLNFSSITGKVVSTTPAFYGSNPAEVRTGHRAGFRVLGREEDLARELMAAVSDEQREQIIISGRAPREIITRPGSPLDIGEPAGLRAGEMSSEQLAILSELISQYAHNLREELAEQELGEIRDNGIENVYFAWAGGLDPNENHYFRIHGPTFIVEYDNAQRNHVHAVWHSRENNFGLDVLRRHYEENPHLRPEPAEEASDEAADEAAAEPEPAAAN